MAEVLKVIPKDFFDAITTLSGIPVFSLDLMKNDSTYIIESLSLNTTTTLNGDYVTSISSSTLEPNKGIFDTIAMADSLSGGTYTTLYNEFTHILDVAQISYSIAPIRDGLYAISDYMFIFRQLPDVLPVEIVPITDINIYDISKNILTDVSLAQDGGKIELNGYFDPLTGQPEYAAVQTIYF